MIDSPKLKKTCRPATYKGLSSKGTVSAPSAPHLPYSLSPIPSIPTFCLASKPLSLNLDLIIHLTANLNSKFLTRIHLEFDTWLNNRLKRVNKNYNKCLDTMVANLWDAHQSSSQLITPLQAISITYNNSDKLGYDMIINTLKFLSAKEYIHLNKGEARMNSGIATWCTSTPKLSRWFELDEMQTRLKENATFVVLRKKLPVETVVTKSRTVDNEIEFYQTTATVKRNTDVPIPSSQKAKARRLSKTVRAYNQLWTNSAATLNGYHIRPWCRRIFNNNLNMGGRYYGEFQTLPKADRVNILINSFETTEPDYSGLHFNLLYAQEGIQLGARDDVYKVKGYDRETIKAVMIPLLNTTNLNALAGQITKSGRADIKAAHAKHKEAQKYAANLEARGIKADDNYKPARFLKGFIEGIPEGADGHELLVKLKTRHRAIAHRFGEADLGIKLQNQDAQLMSNVLDALIANNIAALPIHDSIRVQIYHVDFAIETMKEEYHKLTGYSIDVSEVIHIKPRTLRACRG